MNPIYQAMMAQSNPMANFMQRFAQFKQTFNGNPQQMVQNLLNSGKVSKAQYDQAVQVAQQMQGMLR